VIRRGNKVIVQVSKVDSFKKQVDFRLVDDRQQGARPQESGGSRHLGDRSSPSSREARAGRGSGRGARFQDRASKTGSFHTHRRQTGTTASSPQPSPPKEAREATSVHGQWNTPPQGRRQAHPTRQSRPRKS